MHSIMFPLVLFFQLNEQQKVKNVRVTGIEKYCKALSGRSADWYSGVSES